MTPSDRTTTFRPDIAGLRAIAVLSVVLCHFKLPLFAGGFVGVDVFFVISGYLITRNILGDLNAGRFSLTAFYLSRARRILPALVFTVALSFLAGMVWLAPGSLRELAKESTHALLSISNIQYWRETKQYFAASAEQLSLLHCWSLSLEEQFYLIWPAFLLLATRYKRPVLAIGIAALASAAVSLIVLQKDTQAAFFLMPFRIHEFAIGALVIFAERRFALPAYAARALQSLGLIAILVPVVWFDETTTFPGLAVLMPVIGTAMVISAGHARRAPWLLANPIAQFIGAISYSLYLCHWPIMFFARYIFGPDVFSASVIAILGVAMIAVASLMYRFVEQPFRRGPTMATAAVRRRMALRSTAAILTLVAITHVAFRMDGWAWRLPAAAAEQTALLKFGMSPCRSPQEPCVFGDPAGAPGVELVGDSLSHQYVSAFDPLLRELGMRGVASTMGGCPILVGMVLKGPDSQLCERTRDLVFERVRASQSNVFFAQAWNLYTDARVTSLFARPDLPSGEERSIIELEASLDATVALLATGGRRILLLGENVMAPCQIDRTRLAPGPLWHAPQPPCRETTRADALTSGRPINEMLRRIAARWPGRVTLMFPVDVLCRDTCSLSKDGVSLYFDTGHLSVAGAREVGKRADRVLRAFLDPTLSTPSN